MIRLAKIDRHLFVFVFSGLRSSPYHQKMVWTELGEPLGCGRLLDLLPFNSVSRGASRHTKYAIIQRVCVRMLSFDGSQLWDRCPWQSPFPVLRWFSLTEDVLSCRMSTVILAPCPKPFQLFSLFWWVHMEKCYGWVFFLLLYFCFVLGGVFY